MRVDKKFAPITLTIETEEDKSFLLEIIDKATRYHMTSGKRFLSPRKYEDSFPQKCIYLEGMIR